jgi:hypothetical protein
MDTAQLSRSSHQPSASAPGEDVRRHQPHDHQGSRPRRNSRGPPQDLPRLAPFRHHIDPLITNPSVTIWSIWMTLVGGHDAELSYGTVRDYVTRQRRHAEWDEQR